MIALLAAATYAVTALDAGGETEDPGPNSGFTQHELESMANNPDRSLLLIPSRLPPGASREPEIGFQLTNVVSDPGRGGRQLRVSYYESDALGSGESGGSFRVFQRPTDQAVDDSKPPCAPMGRNVPVVTRTLGETTLDICGQDVQATVAQNYWTTVAFTSDYSQVGW